MVMLVVSREREEDGNKGRGEKMIIIVRTASSGIIKQLQQINESFNTTDRTGRSNKLLSPSLHCMASINVAYD